MQSIGHAASGVMAKALSLPARASSAEQARYFVVTLSAFYVRACFICSEIARHCAQPSSVCFLLDDPHPCLYRPGGMRVAKKDGYRHGLRASELCELQWSDVEFEGATLHIRRAKGGATTTHPLLGDEMRALRALKREAKSPFIFVSERGAPFTVSGLQKLVARAGIEAKIPFKVHPHMLRHATGYALANKGTDTRTLQAYLGHRSIQSTVRYTELAPGRFKNIWR